MADYFREAVKAAITREFTPDFSIVKVKYVEKLDLMW
jgi:hypothetical protein